MTTGVTELERLLPWFEHSDVHSTNLLGEPVELEDLADLYIAHVAAESDIAAVVARVSAWPQVYYASPDVPLVAATTQPNEYTSDGKPMTPFWASLSVTKRAPILWRPSMARPLPI